LGYRAMGPTLRTLRTTHDARACGWYVWAGGEPSGAPDFYHPVCVEHLAERCPAATPFLALPPGWRFLTDGTYVDVWYDPALAGPPPNPRVDRTRIARSGTVGSTFGRGRF
jgi:hypothetical protein